jgi:hypothetical protein
MYFLLPPFCFSIASLLVYNQQRKEQIAMLTILHHGLYDMYLKMVIFRKW